MKATYLKPTLDETEHRLYMETESYDDYKTLNRLISDGLVSGFGRDPDNGSVMHVQIILRKEP